MKCSNCGFEAAQDSLFCPQCGARMTQVEAPRGTFADRILPALKDPLFLVVCILQSVACVFSLAYGTIPLIGILFTVFLWLAYAQAHKNIADANHLRCVSGTLYAQYILEYVSAGLLLVVGVILAIAFTVAGSSISYLWGAVMDALAVQLGAYNSILALLSTVSGSVFFFICAFFATLKVVFNLFTLRYLHRFTKAVYQGIEQDASEIQHVTTAKIVLFILGGLTLVSSLSGLIGNQLNDFFSSAASGSCAIIAGLLVHKHLKPEA